MALAIVFISHQKLLTYGGAIKDTSHINIANDVVLQMWILHIKYSRQFSHVPTIRNKLTQIRSSVLNLITLWP